MKRLSQISSRNILIIFLTLTALFLAQMVWWIVFQVRNSNQTMTFFLETVESERQWAIELLDAHYAEIYDAASATAAETQGRLPEKRTYCDPAISGMAMQKASAISGLEDSLYFSFPSGGDNLLVFLEQDYPDDLISANEHLSYVAAPKGKLSRAEWVTPALVQIKDDVVRSIMTSRDRHIKMFVMEGSFFVLLIMMGAYAIYLALARTRRIREEQLLFVHSVTHELKIPLTSISLFLDTMRRRNYDTKLVAELAPKMKEDVVRLGDLIDNILLVRKLADKEAETKLEVIDLSFELKRFSSGIRERIESAGGKLSTGIEDGIKVKADFPELIKVWETLVDNSVKYRRESGMALTINLRRVDGEAEIQFQDNGPGIPSGMEKRIFEPFVRANHDPKKSVPGSGLGLFIAREYVRRSKGSISIRNAPAGGCLVAIRFKVAG
ncbi:MAG: hypothetical protein A2W25_09835 [candidate division Zixibacteria bacterium RBG_16_53_22]|nr:MAG: hypothetical protein A2W25_09835 [candidate division Zixibacteria bacterium RBG_16_53_22]